ncbi:hypothetical protein MRX96_014411 [Rhipicephalus microplus]
MAGARLGISLLLGGASRGFTTVKPPKIIAALIWLNTFDLKPSVVFRPVPGGTLIKVGGRWNALNARDRRRAATDRPEVTSERATGVTGREWIACRAADCKRARLCAPCFEKAVAAPRASLNNALAFEASPRGLPGLVYAACVSECMADTTAKGKKAFNYAW